MYVCMYVCMYVKSMSHNATSSVPNLLPGAELATRSYGKKENMAQKSPLYDLVDEDVGWLKALNKSRKNQGKHKIFLFVQ